MNRKPRHPLDVALGARIKEVRKSQDPPVRLLWLAQELETSVQQVQKYETGENRVAWSRLCDIAKALDISVIELIRPVVEPGPKP